MYYKRINSFYSKYFSRVDRSGTEDRFGYFSVYIGISGLRCRRCRAGTAEIGDTGGHFRRFLRIRFRRLCRRPSAGLTIVYSENLYSP